MGVLNENGGSDAWFKLPIEDLLPEELKEEAENLKKGTEVFDVWFDSSLSWTNLIDNQSFAEQTALATTVDGLLPSIDMPELIEDSKPRGRRSLRSLANKKRQRDEAKQEYMR